MAKRGFFAEIQYQNQLAEKRRLQAERENARAYARAVREADRAQHASERAAAQFARASAAEQKVAEREAKRLYAESRAAEVESLNSQLAQFNDEIDSILQATLDVDDHVDLDELRVAVENPPFPRADLEVPTPLPAPIAAPPEPIFVEPAAPTGLGGLFGKKKHAEAVAAAKQDFAIMHAAWQHEASALPGRQLEQIRQRDEMEQQRLAWLEQARVEYRRACDERESEVAVRNHSLDELIDGLRAGAEAAIHEYVGIVLSNSVYPESFPVDHEFEFDAESRELSLAVLVPPPSVLPAVKEYRYVKAKDEIAESAIPKKDLKERYATAVYRVALRSVHEVFEADRLGHIATIALTVATDAVDPATGLNKRVTFVALGADRESFLTFDLSNVVPLATLQHLGASVSKNPFDLIAIDSVQGVRGR
jgi:restriction system protein